MKLAGGERLRRSGGGGLGGVGDRAVARGARRGGVRGAGMARREGVVERGYGRIQRTHGVYSKVSAHRKGATGSDKPSRARPVAGAGADGFGVAPNYRIPPDRGQMRSKNRRPGRGRAAFSVRDRLPRGMPDIVIMTSWCHPGAGGGQGEGAEERVQVGVAEVGGEGAVPGQGPGAGGPLAGQDRQEFRAEYVVHVEARVKVAEHAFEAVQRLAEEQQGGIQADAAVRGGAIEQPDEPVQVGKTRGAKLGERGVEDRRQSARFGRLAGQGVQGGGDEGAVMGERALNESGEVDARLLGEGGGQAPVEDAEAVIGGEDEVTGVGIGVNEGFALMVPHGFGEEPTDDEAGESGAGTRVQVGAVGDLASGEALHGGDPGGVEGKEPRDDEVGYGGVHRSGGFEVALFAVEIDFAGEQVAHAVQGFAVVRGG